jgi:hypothetical protein
MFTSESPFSFSSSPSLLVDLGGRRLASSLPEMEQDGYMLSFNHCPAKTPQNISQRREGIREETSLLIKNGHLSSQAILTSWGGVHRSDGSGGQY